MEGNRLDGGNLVTSLHHRKLDFTKFEVSKKYGFLGDNQPLGCLPREIFGEWENLLSKLSQQIQSESLRQSILELPPVEFSERTLTTELEWQRAYLLLSFLGQGYIWMKGEAGIVNEIPQKLAVPWNRVSKHLGLKPVGSYASTVLYNFGVHDPSLPWDAVDNLHVLHTFTGTRDESHFFLVHALMEIAAAPAICAIGEIHELMETRNDEKIMDCLKTMKASLIKIQEVVAKMYESCDPKTFFVVIRPFFAGSKGLDAFPNGILYEGVDTTPKKYHGASAGQSSVIFALDEFLGIVQSGEVQKFVASMTDYMPALHQKFLQQQKEMVPFPEYCKKSGSKEMRGCFNEVVDELVRFRNQHLILVARYIVNQKESSVNPSLDDKGTGGSHAISFLKGVRDRTIAGKISV